MRPRGCACVRACAFVRFEAPYTLACVPRRRTRREQMGPRARPATLQRRAAQPLHVLIEAEGPPAPPPPRERERLHASAHASPSRTHQKRIGASRCAGGPLRSVNGNHRRIKADPAAFAHADSKRSCRAFFAWSPRPRKEPSDRTARTIVRRMRLQRVSNPRQVCSSRNRRPDPTTALDIEQKRADRTGGTTTPSGACRSFARLAVSPNTHSETTASNGNDIFAPHQIIRNTLKANPPAATSMILTRRAINSLIRRGARVFRPHT